MSAHVTNHVWQNSKQKGSALLLLLALADNARDTGKIYYIRLKEMARKTRLSERNCRRLLRQLEEADELEPVEGCDGVHSYLIVGVVSEQELMDRPTLNLISK